jgi:CrcB protein
VNDILEEISRLHIVGVALGAGAGAVVRAAVDRTMSARLGLMRLPWATLLVNVVGSFLLGLLLALTADAVAGGAAQAEAAQTWRLIAGTGFCGGLTTFSTFSVESFMLLREGRPRGAVAYAALTIVVTLGAVVLGVVIGSEAA